MPLPSRCEWVKAGKRSPRLLNCASGMHFEHPVRVGDDARGVRPHQQASRKRTFNQRSHREDTSRQLDAKIGNKIVATPAWHPEVRRPPRPPGGRPSLRPIPRYGPSHHNREIVTVHGRKHGSAAPWAAVQHAVASAQLARQEQFSRSMLNGTDTRRRDPSRRGSWQLLATRGMIALGRLLDSPHYRSTMKCESRVMGGTAISAAAVDNLLGRLEARASQHHPPRETQGSQHRACSQQLARLIRKQASHSTRRI